MTVEEIVLKSNQTGHVERLEKLLWTANEPLALDISVQGSGKTFVSTYIAKQHFQHVVVIAPKSTLPKWTTMRTKYGLAAAEADVMTYATLRGTKNAKGVSKTSHKLLDRNDYQVLLPADDAGRSRTIWKIDYKPTDYYKKLVDEGVLLIIDEFQNLKNTSAQQHACRELIYAITKHGYDPVCRPPEALPDAKADKKSKKKKKKDEAKKPAALPSFRRRTPLVILSDDEGEGASSIEKTHTQPAADAAMVTADVPMSEETKVQNEEETAAAAAAAAAVPAPETEAPVADGKQEGNKSRVLMLSGSPVDKETQIVTLFRTMGMSTREQLVNYNPWTRRLVWKSAALQEIIHYCNHLDAEKTAELIAPLQKQDEDLAELDAEIELLCGTYDHLSLEQIAEDIDYLADDIARRQRDQERDNRASGFGRRAPPRQTITTESDVIPIVYKLFQQVIKPAIASFCTVEENTVGEQETGSRRVPILHRHNGFYKVVDLKDKGKLREAVSGLAGAASFNSDTGTASFFTTAFSGSGGGTTSGGSAAFGEIVRRLMDIESAKVSTMVRVVTERLAANPHEKIVVCVNYKDTLSKLQNAFAEYSPLVMNGSTSVLTRAKIIDAFLENDEDLSKNRLLIGNLHVLSTGIDLDDKHGSRPRFCLVSPNYSCITLYQLSYRFLRQDTMSDSTIHMLYGADADCRENRILDALARKGNVMRDTTGEQSMTMKYPSDYSEFHEKKEDEKKLQ